MASTAQFALTPVLMSEPVAAKSGSEPGPMRPPASGGLTVVGDPAERLPQDPPIVGPEASLEPAIPFPVRSSGGGSSGGGAAAPPLPTPAPIGLMPCAEVQPVAGTVATLAGGTYGYADGPWMTARFKAPRGMVVDAAGNLFVADSGNRCIRKVGADGAVTTHVGGPDQAVFAEPSGVASAADGRLWVSDALRHAIYLVDLDGTVVLLAGGSGPGFADGQGVLAKFDEPRGLAIGEDGTLYVADLNNHRIRAIDNAGNVTTLAGGDLAERKDGVGGAAGFVSPIAVAAHPDGGVVVADNGDHTIRRVTAAGAATTVAGSGVAGDDDGGASMAAFRTPWSVATDRRGTVYVVDGERASRIRRIDQLGDVTTLAGAAESGYQNGGGAAARLAFAFSLTTDSCGRLFISDGFFRIRQVQ